jgi:hypothetical protein
MAWLVCVENDDRAIPDEPGQLAQFEWDVISTYEDDQSFPNNYWTDYHMFQVNGTKADLDDVISQIKPQVYKCAFDTVDSKWVFNTTNPVSEFKMVWRPAQGTTRKWYNLVHPIKFYSNLGDLTPEEQQLLQTYDIKHASIQSFINKVAKKLDVDPANNVEETDLRNELPAELN